MFYLPLVSSLLVILFSSASGARPLCPEAISPFPCQTPESCSNLWVAAHDIGVKSGFFTKDNQQINLSDIKVGDELAPTNTCVYVRRGAANFGKAASFQLKENELVSIAELKWVPVEGKDPQLWLRIAAPGTKPKEQDSSETCDLRPKDASSPPSGSLPVGGYSLPYYSRAHFDFDILSENEVNILETDEIRFTQENFKAAVVGMFAGMPKDTCDINVVVTDGPRIGTDQNGSIVVTADYKLEKWVCGWFGYKDIWGSGTGTITNFFTPSISVDRKGADVKAVTPQPSFNPDARTQALGAVVFNFVFGPSGVAIFNVALSWLQSLINVDLASHHLLAQGLGAGAADDDLYVPVVLTTRFEPYSEAHKVSINLQGGGSLDVPFGAGYLDLIESGIRLVIRKQDKQKRSVACAIREAL